MGISSGQQCSTRRTAHRRHVIVRVSKTTRCKSVDVRSVEGRTKTVEVCKAKVVDQDDHDIALGSNVAITAESFGLEPTVGRLVAATRTRYSLSREDAQLGQVHIHFPRMGFLMKKAEPS